MSSWSGCLALGLPGGSEWLVIAMIGLLLFGKRLPEVARSMGKSVTEFKKGMRDVTDSIHESINDSDKEHLLPPNSTTTQAAAPTTPESAAHVG